jgi:8-hydroxy-5-deazaflavin:NADPH oxidoreductase
MTNPKALSGPSTVFLSGDDPAAKQTVAGLLTDLGWPREYQLDLGGTRPPAAPSTSFPFS